MNNFTEQEFERYLSVKIDETITVREADASSFVKWLLKLTNGLNAYNSTIAEISMLASSGFPGKRWSDEEKVRWMIKLEKIGINF